MTAWVLDTSAVLAYFWAEPGAERVAKTLESGDHVISTVNLAELVTKFIDHGIPETEIPRLLNGLELTAYVYDNVQALATGVLRRETRQLGLSLGDRACLALAQHLGATALTTDRPWTKLETDIAVECIRPINN